MQNWIFYNTEAEAEAAQNQIYLNRVNAGIKDMCKCGIANPQITTRWAVPMQRVTDNAWGFVIPANGEYMDGVDAPVPSEIFNPLWFPSDEI